MDNDSKKIISAIKETWHKMDSLYGFYAKSAGLNFTAIIILELLSDFSVVYTQKEVCEKLGLPKQLVNIIVKSLWEQGYVKLKEAKDRRNKDIIVTSEGRKYILGIVKPLEKLESIAWKNFTDGEILNYAETTKKYASAFENALKDHHGF
jgi:DNA-binding MarR family transcriptional regulator